MQAEGHLVLVLHAPPGPDDLERQARIFWRDPSGSWSCNADGSVSNLLKKHVGSFTELAEKLEIDLQNASSAHDYFRLLQVTAPLQRASRNMHAALQQAREMVPGDHQLIVARDAAGDAEREFELLYSDAKNGLEYTTARRTEEQSQQSHQMAVSAYRLNRLVAFFFPITALCAIFGMKFASGLEGLPAPLVFWGILGTGLMSGLAIVAMIERKPKDDQVALSAPPRKVTRVSKAAKPVLKARHIA
jgi:Mg2+ and Co2+ transporter CorA